MRLYFLEARFGIDCSLKLEMMTFSRSLSLSLVVFTAITAEIGMVSAVTSTPTTTKSTGVTATTAPVTAVTSNQTPDTTSATGQTTGATVTMNHTTPNMNHTTPECMNCTTAVMSTTENATSSSSEPITTTPMPAPPRFQVNNSDGEPCMLLNFNATLTVSYNTSQGVEIADIPIMDTTSQEGFCDDAGRNFSLYYPSKDDYCASLTLSFDTTGKTTYSSRETVSLLYRDTCFPNSTQYNTTDRSQFTPYNGTIGKSFRCDSISSESNMPNLTLVLDDILIQPFAQRSEVKGYYGQVEECGEDVPTTSVTPTSKPQPKPSPNHAGKVVGIVIGVVAVIGAIVAIAVYVVRKRRYKPTTYENLREDPPRAI